MKTFDKNFQNFNRSLDRRCRELLLRKKVQFLERKKMKVGIWIFLFLLKYDTEEEHVISTEKKVRERNNIPNFFPARLNKKLPLFPQVASKLRTTHKKPFECCVCVRTLSFRVSAACPKIALVLKLCSLCFRVEKYVEKKKRGREKQNLTFQNVLTFLVWDFFTPSSSFHHLLGLALFKVDLCCAVVCWINSTLRAFVVFVTLISPTNCESIKNSESRLM